MQDFLWTIVGAGPAGIAAVGKLLDYGVNKRSILWIDPQFTVGDFGTLWRNVPSNTKVDLFLKFLHSCHAFSYGDSNQSFAINDAAKDKTCYLNLMADPLQWISNKLQHTVYIKKDTVNNLAFNNNHWHLKLSSDEISSKNVILAIGSVPKTLSHDFVKTISLSDAIDEKSIVNHVTSDDVVAVFGSSHSAVLVLKNLIEQCSVKKIINFYRSPLVYAIYTPHEILNDDTGLKGTTAEWSRQHLHDQLLSNLFRCDSNNQNIQDYLPQCTKAVYAIGFQRRNISIEGLNPIVCCDKTGVIATGLYGFGIAFPEAKVNSLGYIEHRVGLWKFMDYLQRVMPQWLENT